MVVKPGDIQRAPLGARAVGGDVGRTRDPDLDGTPISLVEGPTGVAVDRLRRLLTERVVPRMAALGFQRHEQSLVAERDETCWVLDVELAPWSALDRLAFTLAWGVHVPGLDAALGDAHPEGGGAQGGAMPRAWDCPLHGRLGQSPGAIEAHWFSLRALPGPDAVTRPLVTLLDARTAMAVVGGVTADLMPRLRRVDSLTGLQHALVATLERRRGAPTESELCLIRNVAGMSLLLGEKTNAAKWLDYLAARSAASMAPDVVAERLAGLRLRCAG